jgi:hypothetical protein
MEDQNQELGKIENRLVLLEKRISSLERAFISIGSGNINAVPEQLQSEIPVLSIPEEQENKGLESQFGQYGLAWMGNIVLLFGITFLSQYLVIRGYPWVSIIFGYVAVGSIYFLSDFMKKTNEHMAFIFRMNSQIILYYVTLRLYFFSTQPVISDKSIVLILLILISGLQVYFAIKSRSQAFAALSLVFTVATAVFSDTTVIMLVLVILTAIGSEYYYYRFNWKRILLLSVVLTYLLFFFWMIGNPLINHSAQLVPAKNPAVFSLFALGTVYSLLLLSRRKDDSADDFLTELTFLNGIFFTILLAFVVLKFFISSYVGIFSALTLCCLIFSTVLHSRSNWNFASAFYALYGFMAMSIALYGLVGFPEIYLLLSVQSLVVVSMALWFRNRLIVVMNSMLFITILLVYLLSKNPIDQVNFSFAVISLVSARVINWKRSRLQIQTDLIRNLYMISAFFMMLFALGHAVPRQFITLSWATAALLYFFIGYLLRNKKYRLMALGTMICATVYLFVFDLSKIEIIYRVLALLFLAAISIGISLYYSNRIKKQDNRL